MIARRPHGSRRRRGFSVLELVVASAIGAGFSLMLAYALAGTSALAGQTLALAAMEQQSRQVSDVAVRYLRGAGPLGECLSPVGQPVANCDRIGEGDSAFTEATSSRAVFYSYAAKNDAFVGSSSVISEAPDLIRMEVTATGAADPDTGQPGLELVVWSTPGSGSYTNPTWPAEPQVLRRVPVSATSTVFSYFDADGYTLTAEELATTDGRSRIALVRFSPQMTLTVGGTTRTTGVDMTVAIGADRAATAEDL